MLIPFKNGKINFSDKGSGHTIVLIHGYMETSEVWESFADRISQKFRTLSIDLPGHGLSDFCNEVNSMELMAESVTRVLDSLNIPKAFFVGHSMGGYVALAALQFFPERLSGITLFNSHPFADSPDVIEKRKINIALVESGKKSNMIPGFVQNLYAAQNLKTMQKAVDRSLSIASAINDKTIIADLKGMIRRPSSVDLVEKGQIPLLWILGDNDNHINCNEALKSVTLPPNSEVAVLQNVGHMGFIEAEEVSANILTKFASKL
jgi:pimeloyl-ACP methyl ester carboxylesterase